MTAPRKILAVLLLQLAAWAACSWALMLLIGVLHHELSSAIPAIGFWSAFRIAMAASLVTGIWSFFYGLGKGLAK